MEGKNSTGPMLYFIVGALLVAVIAVGYLAMKDDGGSTTNISVDSAPTNNAEEKPTSNFKIDISKDGTVSGSLEKNVD
ncbi:MAG: hypothetical protein KBT63_08830 [Porticoccaceae bacterium]|nr:hypothetical protein [Porticoccaceae bacterium]